jgi:hypothetical protein
MSEDLANVEHLTSRGAFYVMTLRLKLNIRVLANIFLEKEALSVIMYVIRFTVVLFFRHFLNVMFCNLSSIL